MRIRFLVVSILAAVIVASADASAAPRKPSRPAQRAAFAKARASILQRNLIANGDAELEEDGYASGWQPREIVQSESYGHTSGEWDYGVTSGPGARERYFRLAVPDGQESIAVEQWIAVGAESLIVDNIALTYTLSADVGGLVDGLGTSVLSVEFLSNGGAMLAQATTGSVPNAELPRPSAGSASLVKRSATGTVPEGTRRMHVTLTGLHPNFAACPNCSALALADQLSLVLTRIRPKQP
jgi:hypothetical protein